MKHLKDVLLCLLLAAGIATLASVARWLRTLDRVTAELPKAVGAAIAREGAATRQMVAEQIQGIGTRADWRLTAIQHDLFQRWDRSLSVFDRRSGEAIGTVNDAVKTVNDRSRQALDAANALQRDLSPTLANFAALEARYTALPDQIGATLRPSWLKLEPEITCKLPDGSGYGGCWHSRITGLMGEAVRVGGVFTQKFPSMADSFTGIAEDSRGFFDKYVAPHPMRKRDYFKAAGKITLGIGAAGLRGGVF